MAQTLAAGVRYNLGSLYFVGNRALASPFFATALISNGVIPDGDVAATVWLTPDGGAPRVSGARVSGRSSLTFDGPSLQWVTGGSSGAPRARTRTRVHNTARCAALRPLQLSARSRMHNTVGVRGELHAALRPALPHTQINNNFTPRRSPQLAPSTLRRAPTTPPKTRRWWCPRPMACCATQAPTRWRASRLSISRSPRAAGAWPSTEPAARSPSRPRRASPAPSPSRPPGSSAAPWAPRVATRSIFV